MAKNSDGVVSKANINPFIIPVKKLPDKAQAEKTTIVCAQGKKTVIKPNKNVDDRFSRNNKSALKDLNF